MSYKFLLTNENINDVNLEELLKKQSKYEKMLSNLLGIKVRNDAAVFTKLGTTSTSTNKDLLDILDEDGYLEVLENSEFSVPIIKNISSDEMELVKSATSVKQLLDYCDYYNIAITQKLKRELQYNKKTLSEGKEELLSKIEKKISKFDRNWSSIINDINNTYSDSGVWPLYVGTYFLKFKGSKTVYAPLLLKEVEIQKVDNKVYLNSRNDTVVLNDKLSFLLKDTFGIDMPTLNPIADDASLESVSYELDDYLDGRITIIESFEKKFKDLNTTDVTNIEIEKLEGLVLIKAEPTGGTLRDVVLKVINEDKMDNIIELDVIKLLENDKQSIDSILVDKEPILRVCKTDPSQEKAIVSSLRDSTIIIGPPGTGKSQTIANILANIMFNNKKALFISQKRVALEVVLERLGKLSDFTFKLFENSDSSKNKTTIKREFYENLYRSIEHINSYRDSSLLGVNRFKPFISNEQTNYWNSKKKISHISQNDVNNFLNLKLNVPYVNGYLIQNIQNIYHKFKSLNFDNIIENLLSENIKNIDDMSRYFNVPHKLWWTQPKYDSWLKEVFEINKKMLDFSKNHEILPNDYLAIQNFDNHIVADEILNVYDELTRVIPTPNTFENDIEVIFEELSEKMSQKLRQVQIDSELYPNNYPSFRNFYGAINNGKSSSSSQYTKTPSRFIREFKPYIKSLFNIFVGTPESLSNFVDFENEKYDYVIFDEASQIFLHKAVAYLSIADKVIIAGDSQQMQPTNWFDIQFNDENANNDSQDIDALLEFAINYGLKQQMLELNYRSSSAALTSFSSKEFYESKLKTLDYNKELNTPIEVYEVDGVWDNSRNEVEAELMIKLLEENVHKYNKIILLTLNSKQEKFVANLMIERNPKLYELIENNKVILKNLENIQGDEADLVIVSVAYDATTSLSFTYVGRPGGRNALNVAITRAKDKMIVIKSLKSHEIVIGNESNKDLITFKEWLRFLEMNDPERKSYSLDDLILSEVEASEINDDVFKWLTQEGLAELFDIEKNYPIGSYNIHTALIDKNTNKYVLGIEVDSYKNNSNAKKIYEELIRDNFIKSKGYPVLKVSEFLWKNNKSLFRKLLREKINY